MSVFPAILSFKRHRRTSHLLQNRSSVASLKTHDGMFSLSPAMVIAAMAIRNIQLSVSTHSFYHRSEFIILRRFDHDDIVFQILEV